MNVQGLQNPIEVAFTAQDSQNLSLFIKQYNLYSPFKNVERQKRQEMLYESGLSCVYWNTTDLKWRRDGCEVAGVDTTHVKCACRHLTSFAIIFMTPKLTADAPLLENSTSKAAAGKSKSLEVSDIVRWPLDVYIENLQEIWQHNRPSFLSFILKPGAIVLGIYWAMYFSSLIYYSGRDDLKRYEMTKS